MSYYIYSHEALPNPAMMGKPGYTPDACYIRAGGVTLPCLPKQQWMELDQDDSRYKTFYRWNWTQKKANVDEREVQMRAFMPVVKNQFSERGVVMLDHKPSPDEEKRIAAVCEEENMKFRKRQIEFYEDQRQIAIANRGTYPPTPYIDECYEIMQMKKPYSLEALKAQRDPGAEAANRIAQAIADGQKANIDSMKEVVGLMAELATRPAPAPAPKPGIFSNK